MDSNSFEVVSDTADAGGKCVVVVKLLGAVSDSQARTIAESVINTRRSKCRGGVTVKTYADTSDAAPLLLSSLDKNGITHRSRGQEEQKRIPTH